MSVDCGIPRDFRPTMPTTVGCIRYYHGGTIIGHHKHGFIRYSSKVLLRYDCKCFIVGYCHRDAILKFQRYYHWGTMIRYHEGSRAGAMGLRFRKAAVASF